MTRHLMLIRHGETIGNQEKIAHGQSESPLTERGIKQAQKTSELLKSWPIKYHRVYTSPLSRARDTGGFIADALTLPIHCHEGLQEGFLGDWEGITYKALHENGYAPRSIKDDDFCGHNGESPRQVADRMTNAISEILAEHEDENIIIVSHGGAIAHALSVMLKTQPLFGFQYIMHNSAFTELVVAPTIELVHFNYKDHFPEELKVEPIRSSRE
jgi:broad specificity phosphatase PhoE